MKKLIIFGMVMVICALPVIVVRSVLALVASSPDRGVWLNPAVGTTNGYTISTNGIFKARPQGSTVVMSWDNIEAASWALEKSSNLASWSIACYDARPLSSISICYRIPTNELMAVFRLNFQPK